MNCCDTRENIGALLDDELGDEQREQTEDHLLICADCRETREWTLSLSSLLHVSRVDPPSERLDMLVKESFREHCSTKREPLWRRMAFGSFVIPKPAFAAVLVLTIAAPWLAFQIGKINGSEMSIPTPLDASTTTSVQVPAVVETKTVVVEIPVVWERIVTRTLYVPAPRTNLNSKEARDAASESNSESNIVSVSSSIANNGYFTDADLQDFQPPAEIGMRVIKEVKKNEK